MKSHPQPFRRTEWWLSAALGLALAFGAASAQDATSSTTTNEVPQTEMETAGDSGSIEDLTATNELGGSDSLLDTNGQTVATGPDARSRRLQRQRQNRNRKYNAGGTSGQSTVPNGPAATDYSAFHLVTERNIFDPNRAPHQGVRPQPKTVDSFTLVGTMSYQKGEFAFFDGTSSDYKGVLKPADTIAGYKILAVSPESVKLTRDTNEVDLVVGSQMRRQDDGTWVRAAGTSASAASSTGSSSNAQTDAAAGGAESDILKRLRERHEKE